MEQGSECSIVGGVGVILKEEHAKNVVEVKRISDRVVRVTFGN